MTRICKQIISAVDTKAEDASAFTYSNHIQGDEVPSTHKVRDVGKETKTPRI